MVPDFCFSLPASFTIIACSSCYFLSPCFLGHQGICGCIALLLAFVKTLEHLRINLTFATFLLEIYMMVRFLAVFMVVFFFFIVGFTVFYYIMNANSNPAFTTGIAGAFLHTFQASTLGGIEMPSERDYIVIMYLGYLIFVLGMTILMLNLLIAVMSDGYGKVQEGAAAFWCFKQCLALQQYDEGSLEILPTYLALFGCCSKRGCGSGPGNTRPLSSFFGLGQTKRKAEKYDAA